MSDKIITAVLTLCLLAMTLAACCGLLAGFVVNLFEGNFISAGFMLGAIPLLLFLIGCFCWVGYDIIKGGN